MSRSTDRAVGTRALVASAVSALGFFAGHSHAATIQWDNGGGGDYLWSNSQNWNTTNGTIPAAGDTAVFTGASGVPSGTTINTGGDQTILGISIGNGNTTNGFVPNFTVANNTLTLKGRVLGVDDQNVPITMTGINGTDGATILQVKSQTLTGAPIGVGVGNYTISSNLNISVDGNINAVSPNIAMQSGNATLNLTGVLSMPASGSRIGLRIYGGGTVAITNPNNNTLKGAFVVTNGTLIARASDMTNGQFVFGSQNTTLSLGEATVTHTGQSVALLATDGATITRAITVPAPIANANTSGTASIGGASNGLTPGSFTGQITLARPINLRSNGNGANTVEIAGQITGTGNVTKTQPGTLKLSSTSNNYVGSTTLAAGTLLLGAAGVIPNASELIFNSGTLDTDGLSETAGALQLAANSSIDFGSAGTLSLAGVSATAWSSSATLSLLNWDGLLSTGGTTHFFVGASQTLSSNQLAAIDFVNPVGFAPGTYDAEQLSTGEVVPVPEPTSLALLATLAAPALLGRRRAAFAR